MPQILKSTCTLYPNVGRYFLIELTEGKHSACIQFNDREVRVVLTSNSSHRAWRGMGKGFPTLDAAIANYRLEPIKAMLRAAGEANAVAGPGEPHRNKPVLEAAV